MLYKTRNIVVCLGLLSVSLPLFSQQEKVPGKSTDTVKHKILLIPFKPTMLMSEIGKAVNNSTHLSYGKITEAFRSRMDMALLTTFGRYYSTISLLQEAKKTDTTLAYIYSSIGYNYSLLPGQDTTGESHAEFDPTQQKTHFIKNGQLQVPMDYSKRFMNVEVTNPGLILYLFKKYGADIFIFINELDIKNVANAPSEDLTASNFRRQVTVHYSILNTENRYLAKGILTTYFPSNVNDPKEIGEKYFAFIAQAMLKKLNQALLGPQASQKKKATANHTPIMR